MLCLQRQEYFEFLEASPHLLLEFPVIPLLNVDVQL